MIDKHRKMASNLVKRMKRLRKEYGAVFSEVYNAYVFRQLGWHNVVRYFNHDEYILLERIESKGNRIIQKLTIDIDPYVSYLENNRPLQTCSVYQISDEINRQRTMFCNGDRAYNEGTESVYIDELFNRFKNDVDEVADFMAINCIRV